MGFAMGFMGAGAIPKWACMVIFCVMILTLEVLGGMNSVVLTDALQHVSTVVVWILMADQFSIKRPNFCMFSQHPASPCFVQRCR
jgi:Na+/pantothenate symporter